MPSPILERLHFDISNSLANPTALHEVDPRKFLQFAKNCGTHAIEMVSGGEPRKVKSFTDTTVRMSELGTPCLRQLMLKWYEPSKGEPPFAEAGNPFLNVKFTFGDLVEELAVVMIENAGYEVTDRQKRVETPDYELTSWKARGSMDGKIGNCVVDIKSCADVSFQKYKRLGNTLGDDPFGYAAQIDGYAYCEGTDERAIIFMNKHDGEIHIVDRTDESISAPYDRLIEIDTASSNMFQGKLPPMHPEAQTSNANGVKLGTVCSYCPFKYHCYQTAGMEITGHIKSGRPHYYVKESLTKEGHAERNSKASTIIHPPQAYQV